MSGKLRAGALDRQITLLKPGELIDDGYTTKPGVPVIAGKRRASVKVEKGGEQFQSEQLRGKRVMSVWLRSDILTRSIAENWQVQYEGRTFDLVAPPMEVGRREGVELMIEAVD
ncbi:head-tail adaptor protein [Qipengyuania sp. NPDC077410]|uniref:head-tail adaptor protein n=1 Tax=Qipengyuania sp. NPDC077410 TaxID=3364496 RepID=UPI0037CB8859